MKDLKQCREQLDIIDKEIIKLFEKRMSVIKDVALYKKQNNLPIVDEEREKIILQNNLEKFNNPELKQYYQTILKAYIDVSKQYQINLIKKEIIIQ